MTYKTKLNQTLLESLYWEALCLAEELQQTVEEKNRARENRIDGTQTVVADTTAFSQETFRTTTRIMHAIAWLMDRRACLDGMISAQQLEMQPALPSLIDQESWSISGGQTPDLIGQINAFYIRIARLDRHWRAERERCAEPAAAAKGQRSAAYY
ncbi:DUF1465 family protein [Altericroceibacterium endophyticum]|uniref:DUF1465 family protein n=1 Tax=Altericroceibacterium endophyticum TaxID=1808508 RepID=A0A6I4T7F6_9SPHN|nr:DUF1465 family protein [Altericroceibacterium endophyticum]MXO66618.1 DUF1465 family protein [Altericroceibacterium endophyticum]